jgi:hypothetical protein
MADKLGDMLVGRGIITPQQLEEALKSQVIFGGRIGTNLIELGYVEEEVLARVLAEKFGVPFAEPRQLSDISPEIIALLPREIVERFKVLPVSLDKKRLTVVMSDPSDLSALDEISFRTGFIIRPLVTSEIRLVAALEKYYDIRREFRYITLGLEGRNAKAPLAGTVSARRQPEPEMVDFSALSEVVLEPEPLAPAPAPPVPKPSAPPPPLAPAPSAPKPSAPPPEPPPVVAAPPAPEKTSYTIDNLLLDLANATERDEISTCMVNYLGHEYERAALFLVRGGTVQGWRYVMRGKAITLFNQVDFPLTEGGALMPVVSGKSSRLGPIPATPDNAALLDALGGSDGLPVCLVPLLMVGRVVAVLFVADGSKPMNEALPYLQTIMSKASMAFEILVLRNKIMVL